MVHGESSGCTGLAVGQGKVWAGQVRGCTEAFPGGGAGTSLGSPGLCTPQVLCHVSPWERRPLQGGGRGILDRGISLWGLLPPEAKSRSRPVPAFSHL